jgi:hypothetical protein
LFTEKREKIALDIVGFYIQSIFKTPDNNSKTWYPKLTSDDSHRLTQELQRILGHDNDPLLQHLSLSAAVYSHIYRKLKTETRLDLDCTNPSPLGPISIADLYFEMHEGYYPRNKIAQLYYCEKLGASKIAERLNVNINTVKYHLRYFNKKYPKKS